MARGRKIPTSVPQFGHLEKRKTSDNWYMVYRPAPGAKRIVRSTGTADQQEAYDQLRDLAGKYARGEMGHCDTPTRVTFARLFELLEEDYRRHERRSADDMAARVRKHLKPTFGPKRVIDLRKRDVERFVQSKLDEGLDPGSVNKLLAWLRRSLAIGAQDDPPLVLTIPKWFQKVPGEQERTGTLTDEQYQQLKSSMPPHAALALSIAYHTGMRRGLILDLEWRWIDWKAGVIRIPPSADNAANKRKPRAVPIYGDMRAMLEMACEAAQSPYVIEYEGKPVESIKTAWHTACELCQIPDAHFHDLRRTAATNAIKARMPESDIMEMCGWKSPAMLRRYLQNVETRMVSAGETMEKYFEALRSQREVEHTRSGHNIQHNSTSKQFQ